MSGTEVNPDLLDSSGRQLTQAAARFTEALVAFQAELASFGQPWGQDDIGSLVGAAHDEVLAATVECHQSAYDEISAAGSDVSQMAAAHRENETAIGEGLHSLYPGS